MTTSVAETETSIRSTLNRADVEVAPAPAAVPTEPEPTVPCPACGEPADIEWRDTAASTSGPVVHVKLRCPQGRHWFLMLEEDL
jgi:hypothetical protein